GAATNPVGLSPLPKVIDRGGSRSASELTLATVNSSVRFDAPPNHAASEKVPRTRTWLTFSIVEMSGRGAVPCPLFGTPAMVMGTIAWPCADGSVTRTTHGQSLGGRRMANAIEK